MKTKKTLKVTRYSAALAAAWVGGLALIGTGYFFFQVPKQTMLMQIEHQYAESRQGRELAETAARDEVRQKAQQRLEAVQQAIHAYSLPADNVTSLAFEIGKTATELGLSEFASKHRRSQTVSTVEKSKCVAEAFLSVEFKASFDQLAQFINRLERSSPAVYIEELDVRRGQDGRPHEVRMELSFLTTEDASKRSVAMK